MLPAALAAAAAQAWGASEANQAQADADYKNAVEANRAGEAKQNQLGAQATEQMTDRMRQAARDLSMARVVAADGIGRLQSRAANIAAAENEDLSRIQAGAEMNQSLVRDEINAARVALDGANAAAKARGRAIQMKFFGDVATAYGAHDAAQKAKAAEIARAKGATSSYQVTTQ